MKMTFVYKSEEFKTALDKQAEMNHGKIKWPHIEGTHLIVECTLTKDVKDCINLAKTWKTHMKGDLMRMIDGLRVEAINVKETVWQGVLERINEVIISNSQGLTIVVEEVRCTVVIVGYENNVKLLRDKIVQMVSKLEEITKKKKCVTKSKTVENHEFLLLTFDNIKEKLEKNFPGVEVITNQIERKIIIEGQNEDVAQAIISLHDRCNEIWEVSGGRLSQYKRDFLSRKEVKTRVSQMLKDKKNMSCFEFRGSGISLFAFSDEKAVEAAHLLKDEIVEYFFEVFPESAYLLSADIWRNQVKLLESMEYFESLLHLITLTDQNKIIIITFRNLMSLAREFVRDFFLANRIISDSKNIPSGVFEYLEHCHPNKCQEISETLKDHQVQITKSKNNFFVKGTKKGVASAMNYIDEIILKIWAKSYTLKKPGIAEYLKSDKGKITLKKVQGEYNCYIQIGKEEPTRKNDSASMRITKEDNTDYDINLKVKKGDAIINVLNVDQLHPEELTGGLAEKG